MSWLYKKLHNAPQVPPEYVREAYDSFAQTIIKNNQNKHWDTKSKETYSDGISELHNVAFVQYDLPQHIIDWFTNNIVVSGYTDIRISRSTIGDGKLAHTDNTRDYVLIYMIESGGERPETIFYREHDKPIERERGVRIYDYNTISELDRVYIEPHSWVALNTKVLHGVSGLSSHRISFQLGLNDPYELYKGIANE